jgi:DNA topoisomerase-3
VDVNALKTKPPARYTEATLLSAMEGAGKLIDDDELRDAMKEKGLGTPATRAQVIEGLIPRSTCCATAASWCPRPRPSS